jgi:hypothetical protein
VVELYEDQHTAYEDAACNRLSADIERHTDYAEELDGHSAVEGLDRVASMNTPSGEALLVEGLALVALVDNRNGSACSSYYLASYSQCVVEVEHSDDVDPENIPWGSQHCSRCTQPAEVHGVAARLGPLEAVDTLRAAVHGRRRCRSEQAKVIYSPGASV